MESICAILIDEKSEREIEVMNQFKKIESPVGTLTLIANEKKLLAVLWQKEKAGRVKISKGQENEKHSVLILAEKQLKEYFQGKRTDFDLPLEFEGTDFQKKVWKALQNIPFGKTRSYVEIATKIGSPGASRAVGSANGKNPISIVVPCHRVIAQSGKLAGFAGGLEAKQFLLGLEKS